MKARITRLDTSWDFSPSAKKELKAAGITESFLRDRELRFIVCGLKGRAEEEQLPKRDRVAKKTADRFLARSEAAIEHALQMLAQKDTPEWSCKTDLEALLGTKSWELTAGARLALRALLKRAEEVRKLRRSVGTKSSKDARLRYLITELVSLLKKHGCPASTSLNGSIVVCLVTLLHETGCKTLDRETLQKTIREALRHA